MLLPHLPEAETVGDDAVRTELPADLTGPAVARRFVVDHAAGVPAEVVQDAQLLVSELVTNAVRYGRPPIEIQVILHGRGLGVAVEDRGDTLPEVTDPPPGPGDAGGRGLHIVASIAHEWGITRRSHGKSVWFRVGTSSR